MEENMHYIALPTVQRSSGGTRKGPPYRVFAVGSIRDKYEQSPQKQSLIGEPPYYRVMGVAEGDLALEELLPDSRDFNLVDKWVGQTVHEVGRKTVYDADRRLLNQPEASANMTNEEVIRLLSE